MKDPESPESGVGRLDVVDHAPGLGRQAESEMVVQLLGVWLRYDRPGNSAVTCAAQRQMWPAGCRAPAAATA